MYSSKWKIKVHDENNQVFKTKNKQESSTVRLGGSARKKAFSELNNVLHKETSITPFKKSDDSCGLSKLYADVKTPRTNVFEHLKKGQSIKSNKIAIYQEKQSQDIDVNTDADENLYDYFDFPSKYCKEHCEKGENLFDLEATVFSNSEVNRLVESLTFTQSENDEKPDRFDMDMFGHEIKDIDIESLLKMEKAKLSSYTPINETHFSLEIPDFNDLDL